MAQHNYRQKCPECNKQHLNSNNKYGVCSYCYSKHPKLKEEYK
jgi:hypothetical protein